MGYKISFSQIAILTQTLKPNTKYLTYRITKNTLNTKYTLKPKKYKTDGNVESININKI